MERDKENNQTTPIRRTYGGARGEPGSQETYSFHLRDATTDERAQVENTIARLIEEHNSPQKVIYTTLTGHTADGRPFAEATLLPVGDTLRLTLGAGAESALGTPGREMRHLILYLFASYLTLAYGLDEDDLRAICDQADEQMERDEREEMEAAESNQSPS